MCLCINLLGYFILFHVKCSPTQALALRPSNRVVAVRGAEPAARSFQPREQILLPFIVVTEGQSWHCL